MPEDSDVTNNKNKKLSEQEMQDWLDNVHFGSCCSDPIDDEQPSCNADKDKKATK